MSAAVAPALSPTGENAVSSAQEFTEAQWLPAMNLTCQLSVELPLPNFRVRDFLSMRAGSVLASVWSVSRDVPLRVNGILIGWGEMEGAGKRLAVRLNELA